MSMNLRALANPYTQVTNANISVVWLQSTGYTTDANFKRTPTTASTTVQGQVQAMSAETIRHADALNLQGVLRSVYLFGNVQGIVRADGKGGDILQFAEVPGGTVHDWLVSSVIETWPTWCHVIVTLQQT
jgi:hypothetical protein